MTSLESATWRAPGSAALVRGNAVALPLADESVDLIVTSPPYFGQRVYEAGPQQIGCEPTPAEFLEALWAVTAECWRVLKPAGSMFVNLGDKRAGSSAPGTTSGLSGRRVQGDRSGFSSPQRVAEGRAGQGYSKNFYGRRKGKQLLPHRFAIGCMDGQADPDGIGWIVRQDQVWRKLNCIPEPVRDRTHDRHEYVFHLAKGDGYFGACDEIREPHTGGTHAAGPNAAVTSWGSGQGKEHRTGRADPEKFDPRGRLPGSVWDLASEPLIVPEHLGVEHFAAFPQELPRRIILGWSPTGICTACSQPRRPVATVTNVEDRRGRVQGREGDSLAKAHGPDGRAGERYSQVVEIEGYACACVDDSAPTRPAVVLDPFGGTGTTAMVAKALGRFGISLDLSEPYLRLAHWRVFESGHARKSVAATARDNQGVLAV